MHKKLRTHELGRVDVNQYEQLTKFPLVVVLDHVRSCNNIGSFFRTADAMLIDSIHLCGYTATPPNKEIHKTALGAEDSVLWKHFQTTEESVDLLKADGYAVFAVEQVQNSIMLPDFDAKKQGKIALVFGNEVKGVQQSVIDKCDGVIEIPQFGTKHSFNVSVSAGIVMWDIFKQLKWNR
ncbi:MAG: RNA methyltransferase [Mangrovibacterium sp.]